MKRIKKALSVMLTLCMVLTMIPMTAFAAEEDLQVAAGAEAVIDATDNSVITEDAETVITENETQEDFNEELPEETADDSEESDAGIMTLAETDGIALAAATMDTITKTQSVPLDTSKFYRIFHLDNGRKYFSVDQIKAIIDLLAANSYTDLELAVGNNGLRFLLNDMSVSANNTTYSSADVTNGIISGNNSYASSNSTDGNYLNESEMNSIIAYANSKNIGIIPLINTPGHMDAILSCIKTLGISNPAYNNSVRTINVENAEAVNFTLALVNKYIQYFAGKGVKVFNMGCDEYANDIYTSDSTGHGFGHIVGTATYTAYLTYINNMAAQVQNAGMVAMAFNDGLYYNGNKPITLDTNIAVAYWSCGYGGYYVDPASDLVNEGFKIINTNDGWYYVLGRSSGTYGLTNAKANVQNTKVTNVPCRSGYGSQVSNPSGSMICLWCDTPSASYTNTQFNNIKYLIETQASSNPDYFVASVPDTPVYVMSDSNNVITISTETTNTPLTSVSMEATTVSGIESAYTAYDVTINGGEYTGEATVTIPLTDALKNAEKLTGFVVEKDSSITKIAGYVTEDGNSYSFTSPHFSVVGVMDDDAEAEGETVTINLTVGETKTHTQDGSFPGTYPTGNTSIATATVTTGTEGGTSGSDAKLTRVTSISNGEYILGNGSQWIVLNADGTIGSTTEAAAATKWTVTKNSTSYTFKSGDKYLAIISTTTPGAYNSAGNVKYSDIAKNNSSSFAETTYYYETNGQYYPVYYTRTGGPTVTNWFRAYTYNIYYKNGNNYTHIGQETTNGDTTVQLYTKGQDTTTTSLGTQTNSYNWSLNTTYGFYNGSSTGSNYIRYNNGWTLGSRNSSADAFTYTYTPGTPDVPGKDVTTAAFTGVSAGTTYVTIGNITYKIIVSKKTENLTVNVGSSVTVTDSRASSAISSDRGIATVSANGTNLTINGVTEGTTTVVTDTCIYNVTVADKAPAGAYTDDSLTLEYWITNFHVYKTQSTSGVSSATISKSAASTDAGVAITDYAPEQAYSNFDGWKTIYYWQSMRLDSNNKQTTSADDDETSDGTTFTHVRYHGGAWQYKTIDGAWHYFESTDQAVAYYMQKTSVTKEVDTMMKDWGWGLSNQDGYPHVALSVGVVYPDGTLSPTEANIYTQSTTFFNLDSGKTRDIGIVAPIVNDDYEIEKITYTYGKRTTGTSVKWGSSDGITWNKVSTAAGSTWYDETVVWNDTMGTTPMVNGKTSNIKWTQANTAYLVLIYLKPVHHDTNLTVKWVDDTTSTTITTQEVVVDYTGTTAPTFLTDIVNNGKKGAPAGIIDLKDNAYIVNKAGVQQTFNKDLTVMPNIAGQYTSGLYKYESADISSDGKTLTLHYTMDASKLSNNYVVDFGLGVDVPLSDFFTNVTNISKVTTTSNATYADGVITFKPASVMKGVETVTARVEFKSGTPQTLNIGFLPATTVYYEEGFASLNGFAGGSKGTAKQTKQKAGQSSDEYGYDAAYASNSGASAGSEAVSSTKGDTAMFSFTGTGVDVCFNTSSSTGTSTIQVLDANGATKKLIFAKTTATGAYGDTVASGAANTRIASVKGLSHGNYTVKVLNAEGTLKLDGFRVYGTLADEATNENYKADKEENPSYLELRNAVLSAVNAADKNSDEVFAQVFEKTDGKMTGAVVLDVNSSDSHDAQTLLNEGPKNELYLAKGQSVTFKIDTAREVQIGMRAPSGSTTYTVNGTAKNMNSSVDMFYTINSGVTTIVNTGNNVLSITDIKVCDEPAVFGEITASDIEAALSQVQNPVLPVVTADANLNINLKDYSGKVLASTALTANGVEGETAAFAAADIQAAAQAVLPSGYAFAKEIADASVVYGQNGSVDVQIGKVATLKITYKKGSKVVGTATLTHVQTSKTNKTTFSTSEIKAGGPTGYSVVSLAGTSVNFGSSKSINATCL